jgi:hypothetical protein
MRADPQRRRTPFGAFLRGPMIARLERSLAAAGHPVTRKAMYSWLSGETLPRLQHAAVIIRVSRGRLTVFDIVQHRERLRRSIERAGNGTESPTEPRPASR